MAVVSLNAANVMAVWQCGLTYFECFNEYF